MKIFERAISILYKVFAGLKFVLLEHVPLFFLLMLYLGYGFYVEYRLDNYQIIDLTFDMTKLMPNLLLFNFASFITVSYTHLTLPTNREV